MALEPFTLPHWDVIQRPDGSGAVVDLHGTPDCPGAIFPSPAEAYAAMKAAEKMAPWPLKEEAR